MNKPIMLDLFCGAGGAARGYQQAGFYVVGVDIKPQVNYCGDEFIQDDALDFINPHRLKNMLEWHSADFDAIHASPPCQAYIQRNKNLATKHPRLIEPTRELLLGTGLPFVIENVLPEVLHSPAQLCGTAFGLPLIRHRFFECHGFAAFSIPCHHEGSVSAGDYAAVYAFGGKGPRHGAGVREARPREARVTWEEAMGIDWMKRDELSQAIPPAYTRYIGEQLMAVLA